MRMVTTIPSNDSLTVGQLRGIINGLADDIEIVIATNDEHNSMGFISQAHVDPNGDDDFGLVVLTANGT